MKRLLVALLIFVAGISAAQAQNSKATMITQTANCFPDNIVGAITPAIARGCFDGMINSYQQYTGVNAQVGTTYTFQASDYGQLVTFTNSSPVAVALPQATGGFSTYNTYASNLGVGAVTITPTISNINGAASLILQSGQSVQIVSDGTNYKIVGFISGTITVGATAITGGATGKIVFDNGGLVGEYAISGTGSVVMSASPTITGTVAGSATYTAPTITVPSFAFGTGATSTINATSANTGNINNFTVENTGTLSNGSTQAILAAGLAGNNISLIATGGANPFGELAIGAGLTGGLVISGNGNPIDIVGIFNLLSVSGGGTSTAYVCVDASSNVKIQTAVCH